MADVPPFSMPLTAASETARSAAFRASLVPSTTDLETNGEVEKTRVRDNGKIRRGAARRKDMVLDDWKSGIEVGRMGYGRFMSFCGGVYRAE